jgi:hypothetical protein
VSRRFFAASEMRIGAPQRIHNCLIAAFEYGKHYWDMNAQAINKKISSSAKIGERELFQARRIGNYGRQIRRINDLIHISTYFFGIVFGDIQQIYDYCWFECDKMHSVVNRDSLMHSKDIPLAHQRIRN